MRQKNKRERERERERRGGSERDDNVYLSVTYQSLRYKRQSTRKARYSFFFNFRPYSLPLQRTEAHGGEVVRCNVVFFHNEVMAPTQGMPRASALLRGKSDT